MTQQIIPDLSRQARDQGAVGSSHFTSRRLAFVSQLASPASAGQVPMAQNRRGPLNETLAHLGDQLVQGMALFPKTGRIIVNQYGVFIPQVVLGHDVSVKYESERLSDGEVRVVVYSRRHNKAIQPGLTVDALDCSLELRWLDQHRQEYIGQWVALQGDRLLAHGMSACAVYDAARSLGVDVPSLLRIEPTEELPFGGW
jgi:hypothetical protein